MFHTKLHNKLSPRLRIAHELKWAELCKLDNQFTATYLINPHCAFTHLPKSKLSNQFIVTP